MKIRMNVPLIDANIEIVTAGFYGEKPYRFNFVPADLPERSKPEVTRSLLKVITGRQLMPDSLSRIHRIRRPVTIRESRSRTIAPATEVKNQADSLSS